MKLAALALFLLNVAPAQTPDLDAAALLDRLVGSWTMTGMLGGKEATHDIDSRWVLNREYVEFHELSREHRPDGSPAYEAMLLFAWYAKTSEFMCLFLDNTVGGGLSPEGLARGTRSGDSIAVVFACRSGECPPGVSEHESLHLTFDYTRSTDTWRMTIDDVADGKTSRFADMKLTRTPRR
jgi:hypothetical protein